MKLVGIVSGILVGLLGLGAGVIVLAHETSRVSGEEPFDYTEIIVNPPSNPVDTEERLPPPVIEPTPSATVFPTLAPTTPPLPTKTPTVEPTPTTAPSMTPTPTIKPSVTPILTQTDVKTLISLMARQFNVDEGTLLYIAQCESSLNPMAAHLSYAGLYQFSPEAWQTYRKLMDKDANSDLRTDPLAAIETAAYVLSIGKERIWPSCLP